MRTGSRPHLVAMAGAAMAAFLPISAGAGPAPHGVWIDDTGRGGVEIKDCGGKLCGHVVWVQDPKFSKTCGTQIIGDAVSVSEAVWDKGWIYSPEKKSKFDVEVTAVGADKLQVVGYMGTKIFSKTMIWTRAPADIVKCAVAPVEAAAPKKSEKAPSSNAADNAAAVAIAKPPQPDRVAEPGRAAARPDAGSATPVAPKAEPLREQAAATKSKPAVREKVARADPPPRRNPRRERCTIDVPYFTMSYPCDDD